MGLALFKNAVVFVFIFISAPSAFSDDYGRIAKNQYEILARMIMSGEPFRPKPYSKTMANEIVFDAERFKVLKPILSNNSLQPSHQFPFENSSEGMGDISEVNFGFCAGITGIVRDFSLLAVFDPHGQLEDLPPFKPDSEEWTKFYLRKFELIKQGKVVIVPGLTDLVGFMSHRALARAVKIEVAQEWARKAAQLQSLGAFLNIKEANAEHALRFKTNLLKILKLGLKPKVWFKARVDFSSRPSTEVSFEALSYIHVLQVFNVLENDDQSFDLQMWDVNDLSNPIQYLHVYSNGLAHYEPWNEISDGNISFYDFEPGEEWEWSKYILSWESFKSADPNRFMKISTGFKSPSF